MKFGPEQNPLPDEQWRAMMIVRLCQLFPGWTWEYAESVINRPAIMNKIEAVIAAQQKAAKKPKTKT